MHHDDGGSNSSSNRRRRASGSQPPPSHAPAVDRSINPTAVNLIDAALLPGARPIDRLTNAP